MKLIIDAMGGDNAPKDIIEASVQAVNEFCINVILVGKEDEIEKELQNHNINDRSLIQVYNATEIISNHDTPAMAIKKKKDSSMVVGLNLLKDGKGDGFISAGNTGALMAGALFIVKRIKGVDRPALAPVIPTEKGGAVVVDAGSNVDCKPINLVQFGVMGSIYMNKAYDIDSPKVGLVNIGTEESKGNELTKQTFVLLKELDNINFVGNIEGREVNEGIADVIVCDGFVGNVLVKVMEGTGAIVGKFVKEELKRNWITMLGAFIAKSAFRRIKKRMDYKEYGGALLIGVNAPVVKAHGSSDTLLFFNTIKQLKKIVESSLVEDIKDEISKMEENV